MKLCNSMQHNPSWQANRSSACQEIPRILWNPQVQYCRHKSLPPLHNLSQINPVHAPLSHLKMHFNIILLFMLLSFKSPLSLQFPHQTLYTPVLSPYPAKFFIYLIIRLIFVEKYRSYSSSFCSLLQFSVTLSHLGPNIFLSTLILNTFSLCSSLIVIDQVSHPYKTTVRFIILYIIIFVFLSDKRLCTKW